MTASRSRARIRAALAGALALALLLPAGAVSAQDASPAASPAAEAPTYLFVMSAASGSVDAETLTLHGVPAVVWFTDRPARDAGQVLPDVLERAWPEIVDAFDGVAPNAVLSVLGDDAVTNTVIKLIGVDSVTRDASGTADDVVFRYTIVDGELPAGEIGVASLFIDNLALTPDGFLLLGAVRLGCPTSSSTSSNCLGL